MLTSDLPDTGYAVYGGAMAAIWAGYLILRRRQDRAAASALNAANKAGLGEPASLHPVVDAAGCIGCGACARACPEGGVLGLIGGKAQLVEPARCIGHGACHAACPVGAITLVFGTEKRGVDIPLLGPDFQTNVPGIFIAGELGGMGLIRNAIEQGRQAVDFMRQLDGVGRAEALDLVIVGAGPAGFSATLAAMQHGLRSVTVEQETLGGAVAHYPRGKLVMTAPAHLPLVGKVRLGETSKEELLDFWQGVERQTGARINYSERVEAVSTEKPGFVVRTTKASYRARAVLLAVGRRGTPRRLGVPGEEQSKVVYRLIDPEQYRGRRVLVAGGGDSAIEAAIALAAEPETVVTLSYRGEAFGRIKEKNRTALGVAAENRRLDVFLRSNLSRIGAQEVELDRDGEPLTLPNDAVVVCAGGILPTAFLRDIGVIVETKHGTA